MQSAMHTVIRAADIRESCDANDGVAPFGFSAADGRTRGDRAAGGRCGGGKSDNKKVDKLGSDRITASPAAIVLKREWGVEAVRMGMMTRPTRLR